MTLASLSLCRRSALRTGIDCASIPAGNILLLIVLSLASAAFGQTTPRIIPSDSLESKAVFVGQNVSFSAVASGTLPLAYQWSLNGAPLSGKTTRTLTITSAQPLDGGDYAVVVSNSFGSATNTPAARLYIIPTNRIVAANFTNQGGLRLPYFYELPLNYDTTRKYPLVCVFHGSGGLDESTWGSFLSTSPELQTYASFQSQSIDPVILVWPSRRKGNDAWTDTYLDQVSTWIEAMTARFSVDTNRIYLQGLSEGGHAAWDSLALRTNNYAGGSIISGWSGSTPASVIKHIPLWLSHSAADPTVAVSRSRDAVRALRQTGGTPIYTEYASGDHRTSISATLLMPPANTWLLSQRLGARSTLAPFIAIQKQTADEPFLTDASAMELGVVATSFGPTISGLVWTNLANGENGNAAGSGTWTTTPIPLQANQTNVITLTATISNWSPVLGGNTTINNSIAVLSTTITLTKITFRPVATHAAVQMTLQGARNLQYDIQASDNLKAWSSLGTITITNLDGTALITDPSPPANTRFYRAVLR